MFNINKSIFINYYNSFGLMSAKVFINKFSNNNTNKINKLLGSLPIMRLKNLLNKRLSSHTLSMNTITIKTV